MFVVIAAVIVIVAVLFIAWPLFRKGSSPLSQGMDTAGREESIDLETEKQNILESLTDLESDRQGGKLTQADYERLKDIDEHRLAGILDMIDSAAAAAKISARHQTGTGSTEQAPRFRTMNIAGFLLLTALVIGGSSGIYYYQNVKTQNQNQEAMMENQGDPSMDGAANPLEMVAQLERKLRQNPDDLQGQIMAGRSYMTIDRPEDARKAWNKVIELDPANVEAHYSLGYLLIQTADAGTPQNFEKAIGHLDAALLLSPGLPAALYYKGLALTHLKKYDEAESNWNSALHGLPPGSEDAEFVKDALRKLKNGKR
ncbi:MAG: tetratricopeptide repeat protein [Nitrospirae bacterium]|nr:tetratricopeptide repeat protein [Nitrospirota bacterium]